MAGHSKWKNIRIRKGKQDAIRGKLFTKISREIIMAAKAGGGDIDGNLRLRVAVQKARDNSMPMDNIKRSIQRGTGEIEGASYEELTYEGYGPGGAAVLMECYTENRNRTVSDIRHAFSKCDGNLAENGSVSWQFKRLGQIYISLEDNPSADEDSVTMAALEGGAEDIQTDEEGVTVYTDVTDLHTANEALMNAGFKTSEVSLTYIATNKVTPPEGDIPKLLKLLEMLEDLDDVNETYVNVDITDDMLQEA
ncbi:MAG: YebC/PmpR family DNA-binding transcriptional regulator [Armatimonadetes bacterium]|nr:YebC/PmpR family DNA-binding transcriptional regulator [Armatimonadota bacterium]